MFNFTTKQQRALDAAGNILVSAAAGSGKTRIMTERVCQILASGDADISEVLVLTFTDLAAGEMKNRIYLRLYELSQDNEDLGIISESVLNADISTIHSFCQKLIKENYFDLALSPTFSIASDTDSKKLFENSMSEVLQTRLEKGDEDINRLFSKYGKRTGESLRDILRSIYREIIVLPNPMEYRDEVIGNYDSIKYKQMIKDIFIKDINQKLDCILETLKNTYDVASKLEFLKTAEVLQEYIDDVNKHIDVFNNATYGEYLMLPHFKKTFRIDKMDDDIKGFFIRNRDYAKKLMIITKTADQLVEFERNIEIECDVLKQDVKALFDIVFEIKGVYEGKKEHLNVLDFNDLEHKAYEIAKKDNFVSKYKYVFIDEYQDTNPIQEAILKRVCGKNNLFMVGDVKQSIYGFRHAMPDIFLQKQNLFVEHEKGEYKHGELIRMNENFRSSNAVIDAANIIMGEVLTEDFGGIDYKKSEALVAGKNLDGGYCGFDIIDADESIYEASDDAKSLNTVQVEAFAVGRKIKELIGKDIVIGKDLYKTCEYKDVVILLREVKNSGVIYKRVIESIGIPVDCDISSSDTPVYIEVFNNLLKIANNPMNDIALLSVMNFARFGFSVNDFVSIRDKDYDKSFYQKLLDYMQNDDDLANRIKSFFDMLKDIREKSMVLPKAEFLHYCVSIIGFEEYLPANDMVNYDLLLAYVSKLNQQTAKTAGLYRIVEFILDGEKTGHNIELSQVSNSKNSVKVMTIHSSKGLEFPIVIMGGLEKSLTIANRRAMNIDKTLGVGLKLVNTEKNLSKNGIILSAINLLKAKKDIEESVRIMYVAMTRAEGSLYLVGAAKSLKNKIYLWITSGKNRIALSDSFMDFIAPSLISKSRFIDSFNISCFMPARINEFDDIDVRLLGKSTVKQEIIKNDAEIFGEFLGAKAYDVNVGYRYKFENNKNIPSKKSVSDVIKTDINEIDDSKNILQLIDEKNDIKKASIVGTVFHKFMQHVSFEKTDLKDLTEKRDWMISENILESEIAKEIPLDRVLIMLNSDLFDRIRFAKHVYREKNFTIKLDSGELSYNKGEMIVVQGTIDCCFIEDDEFVLIDYKTDRKITQEKIKKYTNQLNYYSLALENLTERKVKQRIIYFVHSGYYIV